MWSQPAMARRSLTSPAVQGDYAVVGDFDGYLHWLKLDTGELAARTRVSRDALRAAPVVVDSILVAPATDGGLSAYRVESDREWGAQEKLHTASPVKALRRPDRKRTRLNSRQQCANRLPTSA